MEPFDKLTYPSKREFRKIMDSKVPEKEGICDIYPAARKLIEKWMS